MGLLEKLLIAYVAHILCLLDSVARNHIATTKNKNKTKTEKQTKTKVKANHWSEGKRKYLINPTLSRKITKKKEQMRKMEKNRQW